MSTCTLLWRPWASAEGWWCLCCTSHICAAQLGFAVWQLREPQLHHFLPEEEGNWKEGDSGKNHTWQPGLCETLKQDALCCLTGTNKSCPIAQGKRTGCWSGVSWSCWLSLFSDLKLWTCYWHCSAGTFVWQVASTQWEQEVQASWNVCRNKNCAVGRCPHLLLKCVNKDLVQGTLKSRADIKLY